MDKILKNVDSLDEELDELLKRTTSICQVKAALSAVVMHHHSIIRTSLVFFELNIQFRGPQSGHIQQWKRRGN